MPRIALPIAWPGLCLLLVALASCGRSSSGWVGQGGSIFAGDSDRPSRAEAEADTAAVATGEARFGPAREGGEEAIPERPEPDARRRPPRPVTEEGPGGPELPEQGGRRDSLQVGVEDLLGPGVPDSMGPEAFGRAGDPTAGTDASGPAAGADSLPAAAADDTLGAPLETTSPVWAGWGGEEVVSSWSPAQLPDSAYYETPADRLEGSSLRIWGRAESIDPAEDALLYRMAAAWRARTRLRENPLLDPAARAVLDTTEFRPLVPDAPRLETQDFVAHQIHADLETGRVRISHRYADDVLVQPPIEITIEEYTRRLYAQATRGLWTEILREDLLRTDRREQDRRLINLDIPVELPEGLQGVFGKGKPNLSVSGSESISFKGRSQWFPNQKESELGRRQSKFPQLNMEQRLNLRLTGTIGDKVAVDVEQSSESDTPLANRIKIRYTGYEDEIVQRVELGNTSLRLPGTRYVTFSGQAEGLFGINALAKVGDVDFNLILSKQEGRSDSRSVSRSAETRTITINDLDFIKGRYFFLRDPDGCPWELDGAFLEVYVDDQIGGNNTTDGAVAAIATLDGELPEGEEPAHEGFFNYLEPNTDYQIERSIYTGHPILVLNRPIDARDNRTIVAVRYAGWELVGPDLERGPRFTRGTPAGEQGGDLRLQVIRPVRENPTDLNSGPWGEIANLELKNVYSLGASGILPDGFEMRIRLKRTIGSDNQPDRLPNDGPTFLQVTGLDRSTDTGSGELVAGPDDRVDSNFINYAEGILVFPDLRPFDPSDSDLCLSSECGFCRVDPGGTSRYSPRDLSWPELDPEVYRAPEIYNRSDYDPNPDIFSNYLLEVTYRSPVTDIQLNAFNILEGSEVVTASGRRLQRDRDYRIDYTIGEIKILPGAGVTETEDINVTYSYVPFGGGGSQKTLAGISAFIRPEESKWNVSSTWLFESKGGVPGTEGRRPRLGEEPSRTLVGELAGQYQTDSWWLTDLTNKLPFLEARESSRLEVEGGLGLSFPNPNTRNQLYIDDFEGAKDVLALSLNRRSWIPPSIPLRVLTEEFLDEERATARRGEMLWYTPRRALQEFDLQPTLEEREGDDNRQVLELYLATRGTTPEERRKSWVGVTQPLSPSGIDLSSAQFLDIWVNDDIPYEEKDRREGTLYLELGRTSEDAVWYRNDLFADPATWVTVPPNGRLDTEDQTGDGELDLSDQLDEDSGLDGVLTGMPGDDPFDDYEFETTEGQEEGEYNPIEFRQVNGTEGNQDLDREDLDGNDILDDSNAYFEVAIDLADESLWETDVRRDFVLNDPGEPLSHIPADSSGWRRIRVSLADEDRVRIQKDGATEPIWKLIRHARIWTTGFSGERKRIQIAGIEIIGNRWLENPLSDLLDQPLEEGDIVPNEDFFVGVLNNKDDAAIYRPPFEPANRTDDNLPEREQSITLELRNLQPGHKASAYRTYPRPQDFSSLYETLQFYLNSRIVSGNADLRFSIRLGRDASPDTTNYYEFRMPVPEDWVLASVDLAELSQLQLAEPDSLTGRIERDLGGGRSIVRRGRPSLNEIRRVSFAVENVGRTPLAEGSIWIDELRLDGVKKDRGTASRAAVDVKLSDFATINANVERRGADFLSIGRDRGEGTTTTNLNLRGAFNLEKFVEGWGVNLPLTLNQTKDHRVPKFQPNSDLVLDNPTEEDITDITERSARLSYSKRQSEDGWMRYLVDPFSLDTEYRRRSELTPTRRDTTITRTGALRWSLGLQNQGKIRLGDGPLGLFRGGEFNLLPTLLSWGLSSSETEVDRYTRSDLSEPFSRAPVSDTRSTSLGLSAKAQPIRSVSYDISSNRNLDLRENQSELFGLGLGREVNRRQGLSANYDVPVLRQAVGPRINWTSSSTLDFLRSGGTSENEPDRYNSFSNTNSTSISGRLDLPRLRHLLGDLPFFPSGDDSVGAVRGRSRDSGSPVQIDPISVSYTFGKRSDLDRRKGEPSLLYQLGIDTAPGEGVTALRSASGSTGDTQAWNFDTNLRLPLGATVRAGYRSSSSEGTTNGLPSQNKERTWPDLDIGWGQIHAKLGLDKLLSLKSFSAKTAYSRKKSERSAQGTGTKTVTVTRDLSPLLDVRTTLESGLQATFTSSSTREESDLFLFTRTRNVSLVNRARLELKKSFNLRKRIDIPGSSQSRMVTTRMDVTAGIDWSQNKQETLVIGAEPQVLSDLMSLGFNGTTNYNFTERISGSARLGFGQNADRKNRARTLRFIEVQVSGTFTF